MILHVLPLEGLSEIYINSIRRLGEDEQQVFIVSSTRSAVIKFHPVMMAVRNLLFLPEPKRGDKKKKQMQKEMKKHLLQADKVFWHTAFSSNNRYLLEFMEDENIANKSVWVQTEREFEKINNESLINAVMKFKYIVFTSPFSQSRYQAILPNHKFTSYAIDLPNTTYLCKEWLELKKVYQFAHSGLNVQLGFIPLFQNYVHTYLMTIRYFKKGYNLCIIPYNLTGFRVLTSKDEEYIKKTVDEISAKGHEVSVFRFDSEPDIITVFETIQQMDYICISVNPPYGIDYLCLALLMGKHVFFEHKSYFDYFKDKGVTVFMFNQIPQIKAEQVRTPIKENCENKWLNNRLEFKYSSDQWKSVLNNFSRRKKK